MWIHIGRPTPSGDPSDILVKVNGGHVSGEMREDLPVALFSVRKSVQIHEGQFCRASSEIQKGKHVL